MSIVLGALFVLAACAMLLMDTILFFPLPNKFIGVARDADLIMRCLSLLVMVPWSLLIVVLVGVLLLFHIYLVCTGRTTSEFFKQRRSATGATAATTTSSSTSATAAGLGSISANSNSTTSGSQDVDGTPQDVTGYDTALNNNPTATTTENMAVAGIKKDYFDGSAYAPLAQLEDDLEQQQNHHINMRRRHQPQQEEEGYARHVAAAGVHVTWADAYGNPLDSNSRGSRASSGGSSASGGTVGSGGSGSGGSKGSNNYGNSTSPSVSSSYISPPSTDSTPSHSSSSNDNNKSHGIYASHHQSVATIGATPDGAAAIGANYSGTAATATATAPPSCLTWATMSLLTLSLWVCCHVDATGCDTCSSTTTSSTTTSTSSSSCCGDQQSVRQQQLLAKGPTPTLRNPIKPYAYRYICGFFPRIPSTKLLPMWQYETTEDMQLQDSLYDELLLAIRREADSRNAQHANISSSSGSSSDSQGTDHSNASTPSAAVAAAASPRVAAPAGDIAATTNKVNDTDVAQLAVGDVGDDTTSDDDDVGAVDQWGLGGAFSSCSPNQQLPQQQHQEHRAYEFSLSPFLEDNITV